MDKTRIGFVGVGTISGIYLENITNMFPDMEVLSGRISGRPEKSPGTG